VGSAGFCTALETVNSATFRAFSVSRALFSDTQYRVEKSICIPPMATKLTTITRDMTVKCLEKILLNIGAPLIRRSDP